MNVYDFSVKTQNDEELSLSEYKGKVLLILNSAPGCGFAPQYDELRLLYDEFHRKGFEILDFPCSQFSHDFPETDEEVYEFCLNRYSIGFTQFKRINVIGENMSPLFKYLVDNTEFKGFGISPMSLMLAPLVKKMDPDYKDNKNIKWNFTKFLVDREGNVVCRFEPTQGIKVIENKIKEYFM